MNEPSETSETSEIKKKRGRKPKNYYNDNANQGYCRYVIGPKLEKFEKVFKAKLKKDQRVIAYNTD